MQTTLPIRAGIYGISGDLSRSVTGRVFLAIGASVFVALSAHVSFPVYFSPVPITLQTLAVVLVGFVLGPALGFSALVLYLAEGAVGIPVFSPQGLGGLSQLLGPTGGFLLATPIAAAAAGFGVGVARTVRYQFPVAVIAGTMATSIVLAMGASWLAHLLNVSPGVAWRLAVVPFLPGECLKIATAAALYRLLCQWRRS